MAVTAKVELIDRDLSVRLTEDLSPQKRSMILAGFARQQINEASAINQRILGRIPPLQIFVDGQVGIPLEHVKPDGTIVGKYQLMDEALRWIAEQLELHSPVKRGLYKRSHSLFADGTEISIGSIIPPAEEYVFINSVPYVRKIERGQSSQAPDGVYQVVAVLARRRFRDAAKISYTFRTAISGRFIGGRLGDRSSGRNPAILVKVK